MHHFLKLHHNYVIDAYMAGHTKGTKKHILTALEHHKKEAHSLFAAQC